jgi:hypothetical protein
MSARFPKFLLRSSVVVCLLAGTASWAGCGSDGAGTIHIGSSQARKQMRKSGGEPSPTAAARSHSAPTPGKPAPRSTVSNGVPKKR